MTTKRKPQDTELREIANVPDVVKAFGKSYKITEFTVGQFAQALEYAGFLGVLVAQAMKLSKTPTPDDLINFAAQGVAVSSPAFIPIVSIATREPIEWIEEQRDPIGALEIFVKAVEKNRGFFTPENIKRMRGIFAGFTKETSEAGTEPLTTS